MNLRPYQRAAIDSIGPYFESGGHAPLIVLPTGTGKSVVLAEFIRQACASWPDTHILVLTHVKELVEQDARKIAECWPTAPLGVYSAGLKMRQLRQVTVASIQSVYNKRYIYGRFDLIIVDEAHLIPHSSEGMYRKLLDGSLAANPHVKIIGLTATPYRMKGGHLHEGDGALFDGVAYEYGIAEALEEGYLCRLVAPAAETVDLSGVKKTGGDYNIGQLGERMSAADLVEEHADDIIRHCADRHHWLGFSPTIEHAQLMVAALRKRGVTADYVTGECTDRDEKIRRFKSGATRCLYNMGVLTTGFDFPAIDALICQRATKSPGLYVQIAGRGTRPVYAPGFDLDTREGRLAAIAASQKPNCLFLDYGGNVREHGYIDQVEIRRPGKGGGEAPVKECPRCRNLVPTMTRFCKMEVNGTGLRDDGKTCGHEFEISAREAETVAHTGAVISTDVPPVELEVEKTLFAKHVSRSGIPTLRVDYYSGLQRVSEYICIEHQGYAREKARRWWARRCPWPMPDTVDEAVEAGPYLQPVRKLLVSFASKYPEILRHEF